MIKTLEMIINNEVLFDRMMEIIPRPFVYLCLCFVETQVYRETVEPIVPIIFQRTKATCFAYGQTGK